ncbi:uncharacterized protein LOC117340162 [Pecten maximus]|uniref:uncharacterized protein LOC117340162 n=1 Tax=Pecten maximus TaxID=6579 RepID=UPI0014589C3A|nr:uncharacterized protein LOC117340162 [Pecten maximus]
MASNICDDLSVSMECWKSTLKIDAFPRMAYLHRKLHGKLETFKRSLPPEPKQLRDDLVSVIDNMFYPATIFVIKKTKTGGSNDVENFLSNHMRIGAGAPSRCSNAEMCNNMQCNRNPSVFVTLLSGCGMTTECEEVIRLLKASCLNEKCLRKMLFVIDEKVTSRSQMYKYVESLIPNNPEMSFSDECRGSRIFHSHDRMLLKLISRYLENHLGSEIDHLYSLSKMQFWRQDDEKGSKERVRGKIIDVFNSTHDKLYDLAKQVTCKHPAECTKHQINACLGSILPQYGLLVTKQALQNVCSEENYVTEKQMPYKTFCSLRSYVLLEYLSGTSSSMFSGIVTGTFIWSGKDIRQSNYCVSPDAIADQIISIVVKDGQRISTAMSNEIQQAARDCKKYIEIIETTQGVQEIYDLFNKVVSERYSDDVHICAQISLSRIPGLKSFGYWKNEFEVSVCEERWKDKIQSLIKILHDAIRGDEKACSVGIERRNIHFRSSERDLELHLFTGESGKECYGCVTLFGQRIMDSRLVCFTCKHVVTKKNAFVKLFSNLCDHTQENSQPCNCVVLTGTCIHTHGVEDSNQLSDGFVDISCISVNGSCEVDTSIQGPNPGRKRVICGFDENFRSRRGMDVYKKGEENYTAYGKYIDVMYLTPNEEEEDGGENGIWDCGQDHSVNIPFSDGPRRIDIIEETEDSEVSFGNHGHSGGLVSFVSSNGDTDEVSPAFVYVGKWPDHEKTYMCYRLHEAIECLALNNASAQFCLCFDDNNYQDIHMGNE